MDVPVTSSATGEGMMWGCSVANFEAIKHIQVGIKSDCAKLNNLVVPFVQTSRFHIIDDEAQRRYSQHASRVLR